MLTTVTEPDTVKVPSTIRLSAIVTVPPDESIVKFPDVVSMVFALVTPILIASIVAPANVTL